MSYSNVLLYSIYPDIVCINIETLKRSIYVLTGKNEFVTEVIKTFINFLCSISFYDNFFIPT